MKPDLDKIRELAALRALGVLESDESDAFSCLLEESAEARHELMAFEGVAEAMAKARVIGPQPSPGLRARILQAAESAKARANLEAHLKQLAPKSSDGLAFVRDAAGSGWFRLPIAGAFVKVLSYDGANGYATVLGKLEAGARYPTHAHRQPEDVFMLSGDLHFGSVTLHAGDFHHAEAGTTHQENWSEHGCVLLAVLSKEDLLAQFA
jgi:anti-sigma factor ChrR (cupin superfamily)